MNTCKTCKWWPETDFEAVPHHPELMERMKRVELTTRRCTNPALMGETDCYGELVDPSQALPDSADNHGVGFWTGKDFGCIHHSPK